MQEGVDVSSYQHPNDLPIRWEQVRAAAKTWAAVKFTEGLDYINPWCQIDVTDAAAAGLDVFAYHFGHPGNVAVDEAHYFLSKVPGSIPVCLDIEQTNGFSWADVGAWAHTFLDTLAASGRFVALYCNIEFLQQMPGAPWDYTLWLADPSNVGPGVTRAITQTGTGQVSGISGTTDLDEFGDDTTFHTFFGRQVNPAAPTPAPTRGWFWTWWRNHHPFGRTA